MNTLLIEKSNKFVGKIQGLRNANKEFTTISSVLRFMQDANMMDAGYRDAFATFGVKTINVPKFFTMVCDDNKDDKGNVGIWGEKSIKDDNGNVVRKEAVLRIVKVWTPTKVFKVLTQSNPALFNVEPKAKSDETKDTKKSTGKKGAKKSSSKKA